MPESTEKEYFLKDKNGYVIAKFVKEDQEYGFAGLLFSCSSWVGDSNKPYEYNFYARVMCKWDGCSHWYFDGEDVSDITNYYHMHKDGLENFFAALAFVWKLAGDYWKEFLSSPEDESALKYSTDEYKSEMMNYILKDYEIVEELEST